MRDIETTRQVINGLQALHTKQCVSKNPNSNLDYINFITEKENSVPTDLKYNQNNTQSVHVGGILLKGLIMGVVVGAVKLIANLITGKKESKSKTEKEPTDKYQLSVSITNYLDGKYGNGFSDKLENI